MNRSLGRAWLLAVVLAAGCDSGSDESAASPVAYDQFCAQLASSVCDGVEHCCAGDAGISQSTSEACLDDQADVCESLLLQGSGSGDEPEWYDANTAGTLIKRTKTAAGSCDEFSYPSPSELRKGGDVGSKCQQRFDCLPGLICDLSASEAAGSGGAGGSSGVNPGIDTSVPVGVCAEAPGEGQECRYGCAKGLYCVRMDQSSNVGVCSGPRKLGQECDEFGIPCEEELFCKDDPAGPVCVDLLANGQSCDGDEQCKSNYCAGGVICREPEAEKGQWCQDFLTFDTQVTNVIVPQFP